MIHTRTVCIKRHRRFREAVMRRPGRPYAERERDPSPRGGKLGRETPSPSLPLLLLEHFMTTEPTPRGTLSLFPQRERSTALCLLTL